MHIGIDSFVSAVTDPDTGAVVSPEDRVAHLLEEVTRADEVGLDSFGIGEHHRSEYYDSAPTVLLAAAAARTRRIRLNSAVTVLSADDPVRVFQDFATLDLVSRGRMDMVVGRGSFTEAFPLFGLSLRDYDSLFAEKLDLLLRIRESPTVTWSGRHRAPLTGQGVYPRPLQEQLPIWLGVGGTPESFVRAGMLGLPLMVAIIGGQPHRFRPLVDAYREAGHRAGHPAEQLKVGLHVFGFVGDTTQQAADDFYPGWSEIFTKIAKERGGAAPTRQAYEATCGPTGAYFIGDADTVTAKMLTVSESLGGVDRISLQMTNVRLAHENLLHGIELLGTEVAPAVRRQAMVAAGG
ncbi:Atu2307/SP_0267 family LLM class monooxygenase [Pseudonocardia sp.]|uniref:Atu2307/SP_0267 family LLM class monooxygenase n=1 Tax=Pseudonocardia sp. TaxID=60912 RepID=UPI00262FBC9D|nr:Atu2307/SP_0267 family LLM class monooxygenase [Pseudonocardia sp.]